MKNKINFNSLFSISKYKISFLIVIFGLILISATLTMGSKPEVVFAQGNNSTNSTSSSQSDNQTTGIDNNNPHSNLTQSDNTDSDGDGILDVDEIGYNTNPAIPDYQNGTYIRGIHQEDLKRKDIWSNDIAVS